MTRSASNPKPIPSCRTMQRHTKLQLARAKHATPHAAPCRQHLCLLLAACLTAVVTAIAPEDAHKLSFDPWACIVITACRDGLKREGARVTQVAGHQAGEPTSKRLHRMRQIWKQWQTAPGVCGRSPLGSADTIPCRGRIMYKAHHGHGLHPASKAS